MNNLSLFAGCVLIWGTTWLAITYQLGPVAPEVSVSHRFLLSTLGMRLFFGQAISARMALGGRKTN